MKTGPFTLFRAKARSRLFIFLGITESNVDDILTELQQSLRLKLPELLSPADLTKKEQLLTLTLFNPDFRYYIIISSRVDWNDFQTMAKDFNLPWDEKTVDKEKLERIYEIVTRKKWFNFDPHPGVGFKILEELSAIPGLEIYTIPSFRKKTDW